MNDAIQKIMKVVKNDPAVDNAISFTGGGGASNTANMFVSLKPLEERKISAPHVINRLRPKLNKLTGASSFLQASQDFRIGGRGSQCALSIHHSGRHVADLQTWGPKLLAEMMHLPGFQDVSSDQQNGGLDELLHYDRVTAAQARPDGAVARSATLQRLRSSRRFRSSTRS